MRILYLAPHPFYQERGSPIAAKMLLDILDERGVEVDLVTYNEGDDVSFRHVRHIRTPDLPFLRGIRPGFSAKKLVADVFMFFIVLRLLLRQRYDVIHAVEETAFFAALLKPLFRTPYIYDMDSSLAQQMVEQMPALGGLARVLGAFEGLAVRHAEVVVAVCDALADIARGHGAKRVMLLYDVPMLAAHDGAAVEDVRKAAGIEGQVLMPVISPEPERLKSR